jgi:hypothetical protein
LGLLHTHTASQEKVTRDSKVAMRQGVQYASSQPQAPLGLSLGQLRDAGGCWGRLGLGGAWARGVGVPDGSWIKWCFHGCFLSPALPLSPLPYLLLSVIRPFWERAKVRKRDLIYQEVFTGCF